MLLIKSFGMENFLLRNILFVRFVVWCFSGLDINFGSCVIILLNKCRVINVLVLIMKFFYIKKVNSMLVVSVVLLISFVFSYNIIVEDSLIKSKFIVCVVRFILNR